MSTIAIFGGTDYAKAHVDEIERGDHPRQRFTAGH